MYIYIHVKVYQITGLMQEAKLTFYLIVISYLLKSRGVTACRESWLDRFGWVLKSALLFSGYDSSVVLI